MATIVNTPANGDSGNGMGMVMGVLVLLVVVFLFFVYGLPALRGAGNGGTSSVPQTQGGGGLPQKLDGKIDVNINK